MTRKDYQLIARAMHAARPKLCDRVRVNDANAAYTAWDDSVTALCGVLAMDNSHFNVERFISACDSGVM